MKPIVLAAILGVSGCAVLDADFEDDLLGGRPSTFPAGEPDDQIRLPIGFTGRVISSPFSSSPSPIGSDGTQALEVTGNSSLLFLSEPIAENRSSSRHRLSFLLQSLTTRDVSLRLSGGVSAFVEVEREQIVIRETTSPFTPIRIFPVRNGQSTKFTFTLDPPAGRLNISIQTRSDTPAK